MKDLNRTLWLDLMPVGERIMGEGREGLSEDDVGKAHGVSWKDEKANLSNGGWGKGA